MTAGDTAPAGGPVPPGDTGDTAYSGDYGSAVAELVAGRVVDVPDFPQPGIVFKDVSPVFADPEGFHAVVETIAGRDAVAGGGAMAGVGAVAGIEARGFLLAAAVAYAAGVGVVPVRKAGKLPRATYAASYALEYGEATLEVHRDAFPPGTRVLLVDDVLATGGTARATLELVERAGAVVTGLTVLVELGFLNGRQQVPGHPVHALLTV